MFAVLLRHRLLKALWFMERNRPVDITALSLFFGLGAIMCAAAAAMVHSSGELPQMWRATAVSTLGTGAVSWLLMVCITCVVASLGLWRVSYWGFLAGTILLIIGLIVHFWRAIAANDWWRLLVVVTVAVLLSLYLHRRASLFAHKET